MVKDELFGLHMESGFGSDVGCLFCWGFCEGFFLFYFKSRFNKGLCAIAIDIRHQLLDINDSVLG